MVSPSDLCRLCATSGNYCVPVFGEDGDKILLKHKLRVCSPVIVKPCDVFPKQICLNCLSSLDQIYEFYQKAKRAQEQLGNILKPQRKRKRSQDPDDKKKIRFGSTVLTYLEEDESNETDGTPSRESIDSPKYPPLYVVMDTVPSAQVQIKSSPKDRTNEAIPRVVIDPSEQIMEALTPPGTPLSSSISTSVTEKATEKEGSESKCLPKKSEASTLSKSPTKTMSKTADQTVIKTSPKTVLQPEATGGIAKNKEPSQTKEVPSDQTELSAEMKKKPSTPNLKEEPNAQAKPSPSEEKGGSPVKKQCKYCSKDFREDLLKEHESLHESPHESPLDTPGNRFLCHPCSKSFFIEQAYRNHLSRRHNMDQ